MAPSNQVCHAGWFALQNISGLGNRQWSIAYFAANGELRDAWLGPHLALALSGGIVTGVGVR